MLQFKSHILLKSPSKLNVWSQRYSRFSAGQNNKNPKEIEYYYLLYLKINISEFRLILLDHITSQMVADITGKNGLKTIRKDKLLGFKIEKNRGNQLMKRATLCYV